MDYKKLAADLLSGCEENCANCEYAGDSEFECTIAQLAATAITDLLARAEAAEQKATELDNALSNASKVVKTMQESTIPYYRKRAEAAEKEVEWKNKVIEAAERRFIEAEAENEKLKNCRNQCKIVCLLEKYNEMEEKMIKEKERAEKAERERDAAVSCIFEIEDDLDRGNDNGWARKHIRDWELRRANITLKGETHEDPV